MSGKPDQPLSVETKARARFGLCFIAGTLTLAMAGCGATHKAGPESLAVLADRVQAAVLARGAVCGREGMPLPPQALQPRMPERNTPACRDAVFAQERAGLDLLQAQRREQHQ